MKEENLEGMKPYAAFLEEICKDCAEFQPISCAFVAKGEDGTLYSTYLGMAADTPYDKMELIGAIQADATLDIVTANAKTILEAADCEEDEEDQPS